MEIEEPKKKVHKKLTRDEMKKLFPLYVKQRITGCIRYACTNVNCAKYPGKEFYIFRNSSIY